MKENAVEMIKKLRKENGVTYVELSKRMGVAQEYLVRLERGEVKPTEEQIEVIKSFLKDEKEEISVQDLQEGSDHLFYEVWMLYQSMAHLAKSATARYETPLVNALIESFVVHARNLLCVFYGSRQKPDDVLAADFFDDPAQWEKIRPEKTELLEKVARRVGKEMAHLTYARLKVTSQEKPWAFVEICKDIDKIIKIFQKNVAVQRVVPKLLTINLRDEFRSATGMELP
jgi:transcriptional regulator with XRE-family HTH domain